MLLKTMFLKIDCTLFNIFQIQQSDGNISTLPSTRKGKNCSLCLTGVLVLMLVSLAKSK